MPPRLYTTTRRVDDLERAVDEKPTEAERLWLEVHELRAELIAIKDSLRYVLASPSVLRRP